MSVAALPDIPVKILEDVYFNPNETGFLFAKDNQALHDEVDRVLKEMKADGTLKEISEKYFQTDVYLYHLTKRSKRLRSNVYPNS